MNDDKRGLDLPARAKGGAGNCFPDDRKGRSKAPTDLKDVGFCTLPQERLLLAFFASGVRVIERLFVRLSVRREPESRRRYRPDIATLSRPTERQRPESPVGTN
jgi:hypothetical protein